MTNRPAVTAFRLSAAQQARAMMFALACCAAAIAASLCAAAPQALNPRDALWGLVHDECVPDQLQSHEPRPCVQVDLRDGIETGFAVLKDMRGATQYLLIPTARVPGIETPAVWASGAPNYFADAWEARKYVDEALHRALPRDDIGLAINSLAGRSQDQLHIHVDCIRSDLQQALRQHQASIGTQWAPLDVTFAGHRYLAMWVPGENLGSNNPFRLLAKGLEGAEKNMGEHTLVVVGYTRTDGAAGFVLLEDQVNRGTQDLAHGEDLLDHSCRVATVAQPKS
jgi:CDP-diacylglycerol pyrophosphatase